MLTWTASSPQVVPWTGTHWHQKSTAFSRKGADAAIRKGLVVKSCSSLVHCHCLCRPHKRSPGEVSDLAQYFQKTRTFMRGLPIRGLEALCRRLTLVNVSPHCMLFRQGQPGDSMFMLIKGAAHIYQRYGSSIFAKGALLCLRHMQGQP